MALLDYISLHGKNYFADVIKVTKNLTLKLGDFPGGPNLMHEFFKSMEQLVAEKKFREREI